MQRPGALKQLPWLAMLLALPTLWLPFMLDDTFHRLALEGWLSGEAAHPYFDGWVDPYGLPSCFRFFEPGRGEHFMPWWTDPDLTIRFWRPLSSLDALVDHVAFGDRAWAWHLHSAPHNVERVGSRLPNQSRHAPRHHAEEHRQVCATLHVEVPAHAIAFISGTGNWSGTR